MEMVITVDGMMCTHCKERVERLCKALPGVDRAVVDLAAKTVAVTGDVDVKTLKETITNAGYIIVE